MQKKSPMHEHITFVVSKILFLRLDTVSGKNAQKEIYY